MCVGLANGGYIEPKEEKKMLLLKRKTNFDRINEMSVEEKTKFLYRIAVCCSSNEIECDECILGKEGECTRNYIKQWLESEAEE